MSVTDTYDPVLLETDGIETDFDFDFPVFNETDIVVTIVDLTTLEVVDEPEYGVDYTVTLNTSTIGGTVVFGTAPSDEQYVSIRLALSATQETDIPSGGLFRESQIENALDKLTLLIQQQQEEIDRAILQNPYTTALTIQLPVPEAAKGLAWNADGDGLENVDLPSEAQAAAEAAQAAAEAAQTAAEAAQTAAETAQDGAEAAAALVGALTEELAVVANHVSTDASAAAVFLVDADDDFTLDNPTNPTDGQRIVWRIKQDSTGARTITLGSKFTVSSEIGSIVLSTAANAIDHIGAIYNETDDKFEIVAFASEQA